MQSKKSKNKLNPKNISFVSGAILLMICSYLLFFSSQNIRYQKFRTVTTTDQKINIDIPEQMNETQIGLSAIDYEHRLEDQKLVSHIRVEAQYFGSDIVTSTKGKITNQLKNKKGEYYDIFKSKTNTNPAAKNLNFAGFNDYKVSGKDGLISDFTYQFDGLPISGRILVIFNEEKIYYVIVEAVDDAWLDNLDTWDKVFESLRIS